MKSLKRAVFYIPGFDPRGSKFYKRLFKNELKKYSRATNNDLQFSSTSELNYTIESNDVVTNIHFMEWDNIVKPIYNSNKHIAWLCTLISSIMYFGHPKSAKNLIPYKYQILMLLISVIDIIFHITIIVATIAVYAKFGIIAGISAALASIALSKLYFYIKSKLIDKKIMLWIQSFISLVLYSRIKSKKFEKYADIHINKIKEVIDLDEHDEYIIPVHSAGGYPLIFLLNKLPNKYFSKIKIITMGHCIPIYINQPHLAKHKQNILRSIEENKTIWLDIYSPADPISSRLDTDIHFKNIGIKSRKSQFHKMYDTDKYDELKKNTLLLHFQYIHSGDKQLNTLNFFTMLTQNTPINDYERVVYEH